MGFNISLFVVQLSGIYREAQFDDVDKLLFLKMIRSVILLLQAQSQGRVLLALLLPDRDNHHVFEIKVQSSSANGSTHFLLLEATPLLCLGFKFPQRRNMTC